MSTNRTFVEWLRPALAGVALLCVGAPGSMSAAPPATRPLIPDEPVRGVLSTEGQKARPDGSEKGERLAPDRSLNGFGDLPLMLPPSTQPQQRTRISREQLEHIDKQKNWIFQDGKSDDNSANKMLGVREENPGEEEKEFKSLMERYLEKGSGRGDDKQKRKSGDDADAKTGSESRLESRSGDNPSASTSFMVLPGDASSYGTKGPGMEGTSFGALGGRAPGTSDSSLRPPGNSSGLFAPVGFGRPGALGESPLNFQKSPSQRDWTTEFKQLLDGKSTTGFGRGNEPSGWFNDPSRQSINPVVGVRPDTYGRPAPTAPSGFTLPARPAGFESFNRPTGFGDNNAASLFSLPSKPSSVFGSPATPAASSAPRIGGFQDLPKRQF